MKKLLIVLLAFVAVFAVAYAADINDIRYDVNMKIIKTFVHESGLYCTPGVCLDIIMDEEEFHEKNLDYMYKYGPNDPGRPGKTYRWNSDIDAYIRWYMD